MEAAPNTAAWQHLSLHTSTEVGVCVNRFVDMLEALGFTERDRFGIRLALEEAMVNAVKHGHHNDPAKTVRVRYQADANQFLIEIQDEGRGFDADGVPDPLAPENLERPGGRGVFLMRHYMTWVSFNESGNCVTMCKKRTPLAG